MKDIMCCKGTSRLLGLGILLAGLAVLGGCRGGGAIMPDEKTDLFNGRDFTGWKLHVDEEGVDVDDVWSVKNGVVNGVLQNKGTKATDTSGWICLQSEGSQIEFRNIYVKPIDLYFQ